MRKRRLREIEELEFEIPELDEFNENYTITRSPNNAMIQYFRKNNAPNTEKLFEEMLNNSQQIEWWYKNGEKMERYFAVPYNYLDEHQKARGAAFYPDYIIKYNDGRIGIYDTKSGRTATNEATKQKADALQRFIREHSDLSLCGGIIDVRGDNFFLQDDEDYDLENGEWKAFSI